MSRRILRAGATILGASIALGSPAWGRLPTTPWPMFRHDTRHTGRSEYAGPSDPGLKWSVFFPDELASYSVATGNDGRIVLGDRKHLFALTSSGAFLWSYRMDLYGGAPATVAENVYVGSDDSRLYALNLSGGFLWSYRTGDFIDTSPTGSPDYPSIFCGSSDHRLYSFLSTGEMRWSYIFGGAGTVYSHPEPSLGNDGNIYVGSESDHNLYALGYGGELRWSYDAGGGVATAPVVGPGDSLHVSSFTTGTGILPFHTFTSQGRFEWSYWGGVGANGWFLPNPALGHDGSIAAPNNDGNLYVLASAGGLRWSYNIVDRGQYPSIGSDGSVYCGSYPLYCVASDGALRWSYHPAGAPYIVGAGRMCAPCVDAAGRWTGVGCIVEKSSLPTPTPRPWEIVAGPLVPGRPFEVRVSLNGEIPRIFDLYLFADTAFGPYTIFLEGDVGAGIEPLFRNVPGYSGPASATIRSRAAVPPALQGSEVTFYGGAVDGGKVPPIRSLDELNPETPYVIVIDEERATVSP